MITLTDIYHKALKIYGNLSYHIPWGYALPPLHFLLLITESCNLRCSMCHYVNYLDSPKANTDIGTEELRGIISRIPSYSLITFSGGEPLMRKDTEEVMAFAGKRHKTHLITNGTMLTMKRAKSLADIAARSVLGKGLIMVGFSLEGKKETHEAITNRAGSFDKTLTGIENLMKAKKDSGKRYPKTHLTVVISRKNVGELFDMYELASELGVDVCNFVIQNMSEFVQFLYEGSGEMGLMMPPPPVEAIEGLVLREQIYKIVSRSESSGPKTRFSPLPLKDVFRYYANDLTLEDYSCRYPWLKMGISPKGDVFGCHYLKMGSVLDEEPSRIWNSKPFRDFRQRIKSERIFPGCMGCCFMEHIGGG